MSLSESHQSFQSGRPDHALLVLCMIPAGVPSCNRMISRVGSANLGRKVAMSNACSRVHLIVDPNYGERLRNFAQDEESWVADTVTNQPVIKSIWAAHPADEPLAGITSFRVATDRTPEDWLLDILDAVELHHGQHSQLPAYSVLRVVGAPLSPRLRREFGECGFVRFEDSADGFVAHKLAA